jgi:mRNA interferase RelE/StbE
VANYSVVVKSSVQKELGALDDAAFRRIDRKILALAENPRPPGCKKLKGYKDQWRIRIGDWRVVYFIDDTSEARKHNPRRTPSRGLRWLAALSRARSKMSRADAVPRCDARR